MLPFRQNLTEPERINGNEKKKKISLCENKFQLRLTLTICKTLVLKYWNLATLLLKVKIEKLKYKNNYYYPFIVSNIKNALNFVQT